MKFGPHTPETNLRLKCVALAEGNLDRARQIYDFVSGASDLTPLERARQALSELEGVDATPGR